LSPAERAELNIWTTGERIQPTLPGVEEAAVETRQGIDVVPDPPSAGHRAEPVTLDLTTPAPAAAARSNRDAPLCMSCGVQMQRAGSCFVCPDCGTTSGCS
jgi:ribonucleoside-diphosphate reductase alpha chain